MLRPFVPAENGFASKEAASSRVEHILDRVLALSNAELKAELDRVLTALADRHRDVARILERRFYDMADRFVAGRAVSADQALLVGSYFAEEYSFEAAALFNPSIVPHPDQSGIAPGAVRFVLSLRGTGEGAVSSITFRTGTFSADGALTIAPPSRWAVSPQIEKIPGGAPDDPGVRLFYGEHEDLSQVVIFPVTFRQRHGIEDLRLVRFTDDNGHVTYLGTYTAFSGEAIRQELLRTSDFVTFELNALRGTRSATKGMALFPRRIDGHFAMLGRHDHENIWLLKSSDLYNWDSGSIIITPRWPWEFMQMGNCGSPIEIDEGWLFITHGVGPIRNYCLGACLLDKRDPAKVIARSRQPLFRPGPEMRDGSVPNVTYSCGALVVGRTLLLPYGVADSFTAFASVALDQLLRTME
ncbi:glycoside hydrolase family 130 protein [Sphingomonas oligophenolica]|uniref:Glycoside hydrolase family 130 protein n=1 Tax=Sphingomonas oligophenolica TaxID=301154 RepID=A0ABU9Y8G3_9SPHN